MWQLRSISTMSPGRTSDCTTILFAVDVPLVTKYVWFEPHVLAALSIAFFRLPCGSSSESKPPEVDDVSAMKMLRP